MEHIFSDVAKPFQPARRDISHDLQHLGVLEVSPNRRDKAAHLSEIAFDNVWYGKLNCSYLCMIAAGITEKCAQNID